jgi:hypothetical protein
MIARTASERGVVRAHKACLRIVSVVSLSTRDSVDGVSFAADSAGLIWAIHYNP